MHCLSWEILLIMILHFLKGIKIHSIEYFVVSNKNLFIPVQFQLSLLYLRVLFYLRKSLENEISLKEEQYHSRKGNKTIISMFWEFVSLHKVFHLIFFSIFFFIFYVLHQPLFCGFKQKWLLTLKFYCHRTNYWEKL